MEQPDGLRHRLAPDVGAGRQVNAEIGYGLPVGTRLVATPRVGYSASQYGKDYPAGYGVRILESGSVSFEAGVDALNTTTIRPKAQQPGAFVVPTLARSGTWVVDLIEARQPKPGPPRSPCRMRAKTTACPTSRRPGADSGTIASGAVGGQHRRRRLVNRGTNRTEDGMSLRSWPLVFTYRGVVKGSGFSALVDVTSRVLAEERETDVWLDGAQPGGFAVACADLKAATQGPQGSVPQHPG